MSWCGNEHQLMRASCTNTDPYDVVDPYFVVPKPPLEVMPPKGARAGFGKPLDFRKVHWVRPELVCEVAYLTWTADGLLRAVSYEGLREDKQAKDVRRSLVPSAS